jgi:hypothetical protein
MIDCVLWCGGFCVSISYKMPPSPNTSVRSSIESTSPNACSIAMYAGVP